MSFDIGKREQSEWSRTWWERANDVSVPRVLLIGDSITNGYRELVNKNLSGKAYVDMYVTSKAICDPSYYKELEYVLCEYSYCAIHYNNGLHGWHETDKTYEKGFIYTMRIIGDMQPEAKIITATSTPVTNPGEKRIIDNEKDLAIRRRNSSVIKISAKLCFPINDLYTLMLSHLATQCEDGTHYKEEGRKIQAEKVTESIIEATNIF